MIEILLATYNSSVYLHAQIDSILCQEVQNWRLLIRDSGSTDDTSRIIAGYCEKFPDRIIQIPSGGRATACENFSALLEASSAAYVMFADHDDVWLPNKITLTMEKMISAETLSGMNFPLLVFTDKIVAGERMQTLSKSYFKYENLNPQKTSLNYLLVQNVASGCTMLVNRALVDLACPVPDVAVMHDHWLALTAAAFGRIIYLNAQTMHYRQHSNNIFGASKYGGKYFIRKACEGKQQLMERFLKCILQAQAFLKRFSAALNQNDARLLEAFCSLVYCTRIGRWRIIVKNRIYKNGFCRNFGMFFLLLLLNPKVNPDD